ncbi:MAG TPA: L,D-transpeptidase family protein [Chloroflexota bacterium]
MSRRRFVQLGAGGLALLPALVPASARAAALLDPLSSSTLAYMYALRLVDDPTLDSIGVHLQPNTESDVVGSIPYGTPVPILNTTAGEKLWYGGSTWYKVPLTYGNAWVYEPLLGETPTDGIVAPPLPPPVPEPAQRPAPVGNGRSIVVSLADQFMWAFDGGTVALAVGCTTGGKGLETPAGDYAVKKHVPNYMFNSPWPKTSPDWYPSVQASFALLFHGTGYFLHDAPWRRVFGPKGQGGTGPLGKDDTGSHGCVNLPYWQARSLYGWAPEGTPVRVL